MELKKSKTVTEQVHIKLSGKDIIDLLLAGGHIPSSSDRGINVDFKVPGGGDWSHMSIAVDDENCINVSYKVTREA